MPNQVEVADDFYDTKREPAEHRFACLIKKGGSWKYVKGVDFTGTAKNIVTSARQYVKEHGKVLRYKVDKGDNVTMMAVDPSKDEIARSKLLKRFYEGQQSDGGNGSADSLAVH